MTNVKTFQLFLRDDQKSLEIGNRFRALNAKRQIPLIESTNADLVIAIGGDGTFLRAVRETNFNEKAIYIGSPTGTLCFFMDLPIDELFSFIECFSFEENEVPTRDVPIAPIKIFFRNGATEQLFAFNELIVEGTNRSAISFAQYFDGKLLHNVTACGVHIATANGDTGYSFSAGGALNLTNLPLLISMLDCPISSRITEDCVSKPIICCNTQLRFKPSDRISINIDGQHMDFISADIEAIEVLSCKSIRKMEKEYCKVSAVRDTLLPYRVP